MAVMRLSSLIVAVFVLAVAAPAAHGAVADRYLPIYGAGEGVRLTTGERARLEFGPAAGKVYRAIGGRRTKTLCVGVGERLDVDSISVGQPTVLPRKRGSVRISLRNPDVCALATPRPSSYTVEECAVLRDEDPKWCTRVIVAANARGRAYLDRLARTYELFYASDVAVSNPPDFGLTTIEWLQGALGDIVALPAADASPPAGKVGYWGQGTSHLVVVLLADGGRRFLRRDGDVVSTNDPRLVGRALTVF